MNRFTLWFFVLLITSLNSIAGVIKDITYFKKIGQPDSFLWAPERYKNDFRYDVFYYIPSTLNDAQNVPVLIFTHGGGQSTMTREGSIKAVNLYLPDLKRVADELNMVVVLPAANGLNWGGHTRGMLKDLAALIRSHLNSDVNRIGVSGHSMGGMGITRNYLWGADEFAFFLPMSSGMDENIQTEHHLNKVFNVPYIHLQGTLDHFQVFITRCQEQLRRTKELEQKYGFSSMLDVVFYEGAHNYNYELFKAKLRKLTTHFPRDLYQKQLWGSLLTADRMVTENNINFHVGSEERYFWIELAESDLAEPERTDFFAKIVEQDIFIDMPVVPKRSKVLKVYLDSKMINLNRKIKIYLNGVLVAKRFFLNRKTLVNDPKDKGFKFEDVMSIRLND